MYEGEVKDVRPYYTELFRRKGTSNQRDSYGFVLDVAALGEDWGKRIAGKMSRGKALSTDLYPDDTMTKQQVASWIQSKIPFVCSKPPPALWETRAILLSKLQGDTRPPPEKTRLICVAPFTMRVLDKLLYDQVAADLIG